MHDQRKHDEYLAKAGSTLPPEAKLLVFELEPEVVEGPVTHPRTVVIEFPTRESFWGWYKSPVYQAAINLRLESVAGTFVLATGVEPPRT